MTRRLEIGVSKPQTDATPKQAEAAFERKALFVAAMVQSSIKKVGMVVCAYVVLDTVRQVVVKTVITE